MRTSPFLDFSDPRIGIRPIKADTKDYTTRAAIRVILDALSGGGDRAVCATALGFPVRILGLRIDDNSTCLLNPRIVSSGHFTMLRGETTPHTRAFWRNVIRAKSLVVEGTGLSGRNEQYEVPDLAVVSVQQAFELMDSPEPFAWITPFHRLWLRQEKSSQASLYATVNAGLRAAAMRDGKSGGLQSGSGELIEIILGDDKVACKINSMNPLVPTEPLNQLLLALVLELSGMRNMFVADPGKIGIALAAVLLSPSTNVSFAGCAYPQAAISTLGLSERFREVPCGSSSFPDLRELGVEFSSVVLDLTRQHDAVSLKAINIAAIAKKLSGTDGALFVVAPTQNRDLETILQKYFSALLLFETDTGGSLVYVARKTDVDMGPVRARLLNVATRIGAGSVLLSLDTTAWWLRKDGSRDLI